METPHPHALFHPLASRSQTAKVLPSQDSSQLLFAPVTQPRYRPESAGCRLSEKHGPGNPPRTDKATDLGGWAGCGHTKEKNPYSWWKASTSCSDLPRHWVLLSFSFPIAEQASKGLCVSCLIDAVLKHLEIRNLRNQSRCCINAVRQRGISRAFHTSLPLSSWLHKPCNLNNELTAEFISIWVLSHCIHSNLY